MYIYKLVFMYLCIYMCVCNHTNKRKREHQSEQVRASWEGLEKGDFRKTTREEQLKLEGDKEGNSVET